MALQNMNDYISELQAKEDADRLKWQEYADKVKELNTRNATLGGAARFADTYAALNPVGIKSNYGGSFPDVKESEVLAQNLLDKTKPKDNISGYLRLYQQKMKDEAATGKTGLKNAKDFLTNFRKDKLVESSDLAIKDLGNLKSVLNSGDLVGTKNAAQRMYAKFLEGGQRLSNEDFDLANASPTVAARAKQAWETYMKTGNFTDENKDVILGVANAIEHRAKKSLYDAANGYIGVSESVYGIPSTSAKTMLETFIQQRHGENNQAQPQTTETIELIRDASGKIVRK
jgi:hypothetical protein